MLTEVAVACSAAPISSAIAMNRLLKISSLTGSAVGADARRARDAARSRVEDQVAVASRPRASRARPRWSRRLDDQRRAVDDSSVGQAPRDGRARRRAAGTRSRTLRRPAERASHGSARSLRLDDERIDHRLAVVAIAEAAAVRGGEAARRVARGSSASSSVCRCPPAAAGRGARPAMRRVDALRRQSPRAPRASSALERAPKVLARAAAASCARGSS